MTVNVRSRAVLDRCGFTFVGTFFAAFDDIIDGSEHGDVVYELTRSEWVRRDGSRSVPE
jgi:RimJ/RimL family protein N-acetyltransferase